MLTLFILLPLAGAVMVLMLPQARAHEAKVVALLFAGAAFAVSIVAFVLLDRGAVGYQFVDRFEWIRAADAGFSIHYVVGMDGLSAPLVLLLGLLGTVSVLVSWNIELRAKEYFAYLLVLEAAVAGVFLSLDLIQFFLFWELELVPMYMLISIWGSGRKEYSAMKFLLFTLGGSAFMLVGFLLMGFSAGTFEIAELTAKAPTDAVVPLALIFWAIMLAFLVKLPVFPFHTWLPDAHTDAPTAVSVMLAGVLLKMGGYGILRIALPILPQQAHDSRFILAVLAAVSVIYGAIITLQQTDLKRLVAYSSVSHMGYVLLGVSAMGALGLSGAALQMFTHGAITGLLFVAVGLVYDRTHTREISQMSGLMHNMPLIGSVMVIAGLASLGLPGMAGFVAELTTFLGAMPSQPAATIAAIFGVVLSAGYILWMVQRVFHGPPSPRWAGLTDAGTWWERTAMGSLVVVILAVGIYPALLTDTVQAGIEPIVRIMEALA
ncbi:MAG: NADH-quinone oxidoreductase subunit M [Chloroflexi bacterium]|nr:NADH-quinone oxidoreductase subunit M [Chloroflexota bacterium]MDA1002306.1 NADH-quinone oxidoreductase subunit M [Chloroflexota bacterium]MQC27478.1 NADH-quinone oxidoreductase subunit M [Chloroflexota bacterium]